MLDIHNKNKIRSIREVLYIKKSHMLNVINVRDIREWENNHSCMCNKKQM